MLTTTNWVLLVNNVASVCLDLKVERFQTIPVYAASANKCQHCCGSMHTDATSLRAHANGPNIIGPNNVVTCCVRLHGTTTMLALVDWFDWFKSIRNKCQQMPTLSWFHANGRNKSQHCWAQQCWVRFTNPILLVNNTQHCWALLALVASVCMGL